APAFLRLTAIPGRDGPGRDTAGPRPRMGGDNHELHSRPRHPRRRRLGHRPAAGSRSFEGVASMRWNLRLAAANRGIWKASELQRMLADHGLAISAGKMSGLWSGNQDIIQLS